MSSSTVQTGNCPNNRQSLLVQRTIIGDGGFGGGQSRSLWQQGHFASCLGEETSFEPCNDAYAVERLFGAAASPTHSPIETGCVPRSSKTNSALMPPVRMASQAAIMATARENC